jgi:ribosomal protein S18 acetylase RimI-like enzyme
MADETRAARTQHAHDTTTAIRLYADGDFDELVARWHETNLVSYRYVALQQQHTLADARAFFRDRVRPSCRILVAERAGRLAGLLALEVPWIRQFAVFPEYQRSGIGTALLAEARAASPTELRLFTFRRNATARAFYEKHGFSAVAFGISPAPESEPDVEYRWTA